MPRPAVRVKARNAASGAMSDPPAMMRARRLDMRRKLVPLGAGDAGLLLRTDGTVEAFLPQVSDQRDVRENMVLGMVLMWATQRPDVLERLVEEWRADKPKYAS